MRQAVNTLAAPFHALSWIMERAVSSRGLALVGLLLVAGFSLGPWLRPPLSRDFRALQIPWGIQIGGSLDPYTAVQVPRPRFVTSVGATLLAASGLAALAVLFNRRAFHVVFGVLFVLSAAAVAASVLNHPALIELFDAETQQRGQMRQLVAGQSEHLMTAKTPSRVGNPWKQRRPVNVGLRPDPIVVSWEYTMFGSWAVAVCFVGLIAFSRADWTTRIGLICGWLVLACVLTAGVCWRRAAAEYYFARAASWEHQNDFVAAAAALENVIDVFPNFHRTRRYWLADGRVATRAGLQTMSSQLFQAHQFFKQGELEKAQAILTPAVVESGRDPILSDLLADIISHRALEHVAQGDHSSAEGSWRDASKWAPWRSLCWIGAGTAMAVSTPERASQIEEEFLPKLDQIGDRLVRCDLAALVGDAYFETGNFARARKMYDLSLSIFNLPKLVNSHAQEGMLGM